MIAVITKVNSATKIRTATPQPSNGFKTLMLRFALPFAILTPDQPTLNSESSVFIWTPPGPTFTWSYRNLYFNRDRQDMQDKKNRFTMKNKKQERKSQYRFTTEFTENTEKDNTGESANYFGNSRSNSLTAVLTLCPPCPLWWKQAVLCAFAPLCENGFKVPAQPVKFKK